MFKFILELCESVSVRTFVESQVTCGSPFPKTRKSKQCNQRYKIEADKYFMKLLTLEIDSVLSDPDHVSVDSVRVATLENVCSNFKVI